MYIAQLEVVNYCQHRHLSVSFSRGLTAVIGPNGCGKSNVLSALKWLLVGENTNVGTKGDNIRIDAPATEAAHGRLVFSHAGRNGEIRRHLRPAGPASLVWEDGSVVTGEGPVTAAVLGLLGVPAELLSDVVIVRQEDVFGFLSQSAAKRADCFQRLFQTSDAADLHALLGKHLQSLPQPVSVVPAEQLQERLDAARRQVAEHQQQLQGLPEESAICQQLADISTQLSQTQEAAKRREAWQKDCESLATVQTATLQSQQAAAAWGHRVAELEQALPELARQAHAEQSATQAAAQATQTRQTVLRLTAQRQELLQALESQPALPTHSWTESDVDAALMLLDNLAAERSAWTRTQQGVAAGLSECPTCGTPVTSLRRDPREAPAKVAELTSKISSLRASVDAYHVAQDQRQRQERQRSEWRQTLTSLDQQLAAYPTLDTLPDAQPLPAGDCQQRYAEAQRQLTDARQVWAQEARKQASYEADLRQLQTRLAEAPPAAGAGSPEELQQLRQRQGEIQQLLGQRSVAQSRLFAAEQATQDLVRMLQETQAAQRAAAKEAAWRQLTERRQALVHRDAAPRLVIQSKLEQTEATINQILELFDADYRVQAADGFSFSAIFPGGSRQPAARLSAGQRVILALAFRLALVLLSAEDLGMLFLDEPTAYLDERHIRGFEPVVQRLQQYVATRGLQCVIITHERSLAPLFDAVVELGR